MISRFILFNSNLTLSYLPFSYLKNVCLIDLKSLSYVKCLKFADFNSIKNLNNFRNFHTFCQVFCKRFNFHTFSQVFCKRLNFHSSSRIWNKIKGSADKFLLVFCFFYIFLKIAWLLSPLLHNTRLLYSNEWWVHPCSWMAIYNSVPCMGRKLTYTLWKIGIF